MIKLFYNKGSVSMVLLLIGLIIAVVVLYRDNDDLRKEIKRLKKPINYCPSCGYNLSKIGTNNIPVFKFRIPAVRHIVEESPICLFRSVKFYI